MRSAIESALAVSADLMYAAAACARAYGLRGFDAIHCASAMTIGGVDVLAVSGDERLLDAWLRGGLAVTDTSSGAQVQTPIMRIMSVDNHTMCVSRNREETGNASPLF